MKTGKTLRNLNRGFLLSAVIVIGIVVFLFLQGRADDKLEPELKAMAGEFITDSDKAVILPEEYRVLDAKSGGHTDVYMDYMQIIKDTYSKNNRFYSDNSDLREYTLSWLRSCTGSQISNQNYITSFKSEITQFNRFSVYKGKATLTFEVLSTVETISAEGTKSFTQPAYNILTFEKENGKWVITNYETGLFNFLYYGVNTEENVW